MDEDHLELREGEDSQVDNDNDDDNSIIDFERSTTIENNSFCIKENTVK